VQRIVFLSTTHAFSCLKTYFDDQLPKDHAPYSYSFHGQPIAWTQTPADYGIRYGDRLDVIGLPSDLKCLDPWIERAAREAALKRAAEQKASEMKRTKMEEVVEPRRVFRVVRTGTSTGGTAMYLLNLAGDGKRCHWATADHCSAALKELLLEGKRDGFTEEHTVRLPVEPLKQRRKRQRCRDARSTDYLVRSANAARVRTASKNMSPDEKVRQRKVHSAAQHKSFHTGYFDGLLDTSSDDDDFTSPPPLKRSKIATVAVPRNAAANARASPASSPALTPPANAVQASPGRDGAFANGSAAALDDDALFLQLLEQGL